MSVAVERSSALRATCGRFATGVCVVTTRRSTGERAGLTVNSFTSVSLDPPLVLWSLSKTAPSLDVFERCTHFAVNVLGVAQRELCLRFADGRRDKFADLETVDGTFGVPLIPDAIAQFECCRHALYSAGDHVLVMGRVEAHRHREQPPPLVVFGGRLGAIADADEHATALMAW